MNRTAQSIGTSAQSKASHSLENAPDAIDRSEWVGALQASERCGIPERTLKYWARHERIPAMQPGGPGTRLLIHLPSILDRIRYRGPWLSRS